MRLTKVELKESRNEEREEEDLDEESLKKKSSHRKETAEKEGKMCSRKYLLTHLHFIVQACFSFLTKKSFMNKIWPLEIKSVFYQKT